ncbi:MAG: hypothetical protein CL398_09270 [Acidiferrobacteraceae bacterium]|nr:hypothetical protein [Acidiferrobacteraceae bacterium]|tara:strand:+ start:1762 stop:2229 length:468 start_codon:yes stop_codon:yes gene_type:complete
MKYVLFVCEQNTCRSPTAEAIFRKLSVREVSSLSLTGCSAGTRVEAPESPPTPVACSVALQHGFNMSDLKARMIDPEDFFIFRHILAMDYQILNDLNNMRPNAAVTEPKLLLEYTDNIPLKEIKDPYGKDIATYDRTFKLIFAGVESFIEHLVKR